MGGRPTAPRMFGIGWHWKTTWFCVWLLSQTQGFALPAMPSVVGEEVPPCLVWEQSQGGNNGYDAGFQSGLGYDAEFLPATTQGLNDPVGTVPTIPAYDPCPVSAIHVAGAPRAPPVAQVGFVAAKSGPATWNEFQAATRGQFATRAEAGQAWTAYKEANGIVTGTTRSMAVRSEYLRSLGDNPNTASWMKPWLREGRVPPGYEVDHIRPLSIGGPDTPANMRLQGTDLHRLHHYHYDPWNW